jgi:hypothetical protein
MVIVFNHFLNETDFGALSRKLKLFTVKYAAIEVDTILAITLIALNTTILYMSLENTTETTIK